MYRLRTYALASILMVPACAPANRESDAQSRPSDVEEPRTSKSMRHDLPNFGHPTTTLYRGGQPSKEGFRRLAKMGIDIVVDVRGDREGERKLVESLGMRYVPMGWYCSLPHDKTFAQFLTLIRDNPGKKIFVHCRIGDDRTGMMIASYRMSQEGWSAEKAEKEMENFGFNFAHRRLICPGLLRYENKFPHRFKTSPAFKNVR